jgi:hypothetical protein
MSRPLRVCGQSPRSGPLPDYAHGPSLGFLSQRPSAFGTCEFRDRYVKRAWVSALFGYTA